MSIKASATDSPRHAALMVHAMSVSDQEWILDSLEPHQRVELEALLDDLRQLGIPPDEALLRQVLEPSSQTQPKSAAESLELLASAEVSLLVRLLQQEPPRLAGVLLSVRAWPWKQTVLQALPSACTDAPPAAAALEQAICEAVLRRLQSQSPAYAGPKAGPNIGWKILLPTRRMGMRA